jgi:homoserine O-acetyltransferase
MVISFTSDWRFPAQRSREITDALIGAGRNVSYAEIQSDQGHDAFLLPNPRYEEVLSGYLSRVANQLEASTA